MNQVNMQREGRYTGPSFQADPHKPTPAQQHDAVMAEMKRAREVRRLQRNEQARARRAAGVSKTREQHAADRNTAAIAELLAAGGVVAKSSWTTGRGNYIKARAIPAGADIFFNGQSSAPAHVQAWFAQHPRAERCVAVLQMP